MHVNYNPKTIAFDELFRRLSIKDRAVTASDFLERYLIHEKIDLVTISNQILNSEEFLNKFARIELTFLSKGESKAHDLCYKLGLSEILSCIK